MMKVIFSISILSAILLLASLLAANRYRWVDENALVGRSPEELIDQITKDLEPIGEIPVFDALTQREQDRIDFSAVLPRTFAYDRNELVLIKEIASTCGPTPNATSFSSGTRKTLEYIAAVCANRIPDEDFWSKPPLIHPFGRSFVARAIDELAGFSLADHKSLTKFLHVSELKNLFPDDYQNLRNWERLPDKSRRAWKHHENIILTGSDVWVLMNEVSDEGPSVRQYNAYHHDSLNRHLKTMGLQIDGAAPGKNCLQEQTTYCLSTDGYGAQVRQWSALGMNVSLALLGGSLCLLLLVWWRRRHQQHEERVMILQTLAHELRTPVASMGLSVDLLRKDLDGLSTRGKTAFLRLADDSLRLQRLVETSKEFLNVQKTDRFETSWVCLDSIVEQVVEKNAFEVDFHNKQTQTWVKSNSFWLMICIRNLIDNAFEHGAKPVKLEIQKVAQGAALMISDAGKDGVLKVSMKRAFYKGQNSRGSGLGLSIVTNAVTNLGHRFTIESDPTVVKIEFAECRGEP